MRPPKVAQRTAVYEPGSPIVAAAESTALQVSSDARRAWSQTVLPLGVRTSKATFEETSEKPFAEKVMFCPATRADALGPAVCALKDVDPAAATSFPCVAHAVTAYVPLSMTPPTIAEVEAVQVPSEPRRACIQISPPLGRLTWKATLVGWTDHPPAESRMEAPSPVAETRGLPALAVNADSETAAAMPLRLAQVRTW